MKNLTKLGVASALISVSLLFCACGDNTSKAEAYIKKEYPNAKILSFDEIQKEFGVKNKECLKDDIDNDLFIKSLVFIKHTNGDFEALRVWTNKKNGASGNVTRYNIDKFKAEFTHCF